MPPAKTEKHLGFLDNLRGLAILLVFLYHCLSCSYATDQLAWQGWFRDFNIPFPPFFLFYPLTYGWGGVAIFFVVSGFCIHMSHAKSRTKQFSIFFARRFFRIYPPYLLVLLIFALVFPWTRLNPADHAFRFQMASHLVLLHNLPAWCFFGINPSFWSIAVEAQLYVLYPVLLRLVRGYGWQGALLVTGVIELALRTVVASQGHWQMWFFNYPFYFWFSWTIGAALADDFIEGRPLRFGQFPWWLWPAVTVAFSFIKPLSCFCFMTLALSAATAIAQHDRFDWDGHPGSWTAALARHLRYVGTISYSVYLLHQPFLEMVPKLYAKYLPGQTVHPLVLFVSCLLVWPLILLLAQAFFTYVETPSINLGKWVVKNHLTRPVQEPA